MSVFRWGILGTGEVSRKFVLGLRALDGAAEATVAASRTRVNAERFCGELGVPVVADSYGDAAASPEVDAIYVATPPSEHEAHAMLAFAAGKPVLIEKPFAADADSAGRIAAAAREAGVFCMEAMWSRFLPLVEEVRVRIERGDLGEIRAFRGEFFSADDPAASPSMFDPTLSGGALMHLGVYPVSLARHLLGPIDGVESSARIGETGVDEDCAVILRHRSGAISTARASLRSASDNGATIHGTRGVLQVDGPIYRPHSARFTPVSARTGGTAGNARLAALKEAGLAHSLMQRSSRTVDLLRHGRSDRVTRRYEGNGYHYEARAVMDAVAAGLGECDVMPLHESIEIMQVLDRARSAWGQEAE